ncbi:Condensin complex subunit [Chytriomyces hyalinus]|nr:Condensin complex subunit [Chytriomyces hyalinus]
MQEFELHEQLLWLQEESTSSFEGESLISEMNPSDVAQLMDDLVGCLVEAPENVLQKGAMDALFSFIKNFNILDAHIVANLADIIVDRIKSFVTLTAKDLGSDSQQNQFDSFHKPVIEMYAFLIHWMIDVGEMRYREEKSKEITKAPAGGKGKSKAKASSQPHVLEWESIRARLLEAVGLSLKLDIHRIIISSSERDLYVSMILKSVCLVLEDKDAIKNANTKNAAFAILGLAAKKFDTGPTKSVQMRVIQLIKEEHLAEPVAEFLKKVSDALEYPELLDGVLRESKNWDYSDDDSKQSKAFAKFVVKLSDISSERVLKNMVNLQSHMDSDAYVVRMAMLEVFANLIHNQLSTNASEAAFSQMISFFNILEERFADKSSYVRSKLLQILIKLAERRDIGVTDIPLEHWKPIVALTIGRLHDKASVVRKNAVKLLTRLVESSPFLAIESDKGKQSLAHFESKRNELKKILKEKFPENYGENPEEMDDEEEAESPSKTAEPNEPQNDAAVAAPGTPQELISLRRFLKYYSDGIRFLRQIKTAMPIICELLASNTKTEVIECMRFLSVAFRYEMDLAKEGTKAMIHKIWEKDTSGLEDEGSIRDNLLKCYFIIYMDPRSDGIRSKQEIIATNLIGLIQEMNLAEITSLEQVLGSMILKSMIPDGVIDILWSVFASKRKESTPGRRRGALAILSMFGKAKKEIVAKHVDALLVCGLGEHAQNDLILAKYACVTLQQLGPSKRQKGVLPEVHVRRQMNDPLFTRLCQLMLLPTKSYNWFGFAEQAINTIYLLSEHPDALCAHVIHVYSERIFDETNTVDSVAEKLNANLNLDESDAEDGHVAPAAEGADAAASEEPRLSQAFGQSVANDSNFRDAFELSKLCFLVGHIGIRQIAHLEAIEQEWKRQKQASSEPKAQKGAATDELEQVTGTAEDEFTDAVAYVREMELLFGQKSLLALFGPMISAICRSNLHFNAPILQVMAVLALCKLMCISSKYCDENLQLLFTILEKSNNAVIRSNVIIGLGDMAVSFNSLIDQNISYLYNRLADSDHTVKKNTLMVLTHLILNGMVKVKGQISEMAKCLEDEDSRVSDLAKLFFTELSTKENAIYNNLPDIISNLSHKDTGVDEEQFRSIMKFLFEFLKKEKQNESIIEKLCSRFKNSGDPRLWRDVSYCISLVSFTSEKSVKKLMEALPLYQDKLHEPLVFKYIHDVILKAKKLPKMDKQLMEDYESKLLQCREKCIENEESIQKADASKKKMSGKLRKKDESHEDDDIAEDFEALDLE